MVKLLETAAPSHFSLIAHDAFRSFIKDDSFPCLGARAAFQRETYRFGTYARLDDPDVSKGLMRDLFAFVSERRNMDVPFTTFVAVFREPVPGGEEGFERALWSQLQQLHELDRRFYEWDDRVGNDPNDPRFSFSVMGNAFFIVGLHPGATRSARRFPWPALVFNAHEQFETLRKDGRFRSLQKSIRERDLKLQGSLNPNLSEYGDGSEARQYAGRKLETDWACPFRPKE